MDEKNWKFSILDCITHDYFAIPQLRQSTLSPCWKNIFTSFRSKWYKDQKFVLRLYTSLSNNIGGDAFGNIQTADIDELMQDDLLMMTT